VTSTVHRVRTGHPCNGYGTSLHGPTDLRYQG
jgi:hypothetical protein